MRIINISDEDTASLASLSQEFISVAGITRSERDFLTTLIRKKTPKKVLEIGVSAGGSSVILLHALAKIKNSKLYSIDYSTQLYELVPENSAPQQHTTNLKTGYIVDKYPHLKQNWQLFTGGLACNFIDEIGDGIDFCMIDTMHRLPGEILDFLMIFPYLKEDAILVLHDTNLQTMQGHEVEMSNNILISALSGTKLISQYFMRKTFQIPFPNIAGVELKNQKDALWDIFNLLTLPWAYMPNDHDIELLRETFQKHYTDYFIKMFDDIITYQKKQFHEQQEKLSQCGICKKPIGKLIGTL